MAEEVVDEVQLLEQEDSKANLLALQELYVALVRATEACKREAWKTFGKGRLPTWSYKTRLHAYIFGGQIQNA